MATPFPGVRTRGDVYPDGRVRTRFRRTRRSVYPWSGVLRGVGSGSVAGVEATRREPSLRVESVEQCVEDAV